jgi:glutathione S-transferase
MATSAPPPLRFITISFSHFCEKARWALDRAALPYREESHVPILSWRAVIPAGGRRTVPCLVTPEGVHNDSTDILRWVDRQAAAPPLFPEGAEAAEVARLEEDFDRRLGPATRRLAYFHLLADRAALRSLLLSAGSGWEATLARPAFPLLRTIIVRGLRITAEGASRSRRSLEETFSQVDARLADGRPYLCGDRFTAADLTFAALAAPVLLPPALEPLVRLGGPLPPALRELVDRCRAHPAGAFALRLYQEQRPDRLER